MLRTKIKPTTLGLLLPIMNWKRPWLDAVIGGIVVLWTLLSRCIICGVCDVTVCTHSLRHVNLTDSSFYPKSQDLYLGYIKGGPAGGPRRTYKVQYVMGRLYNNAVCELWRDGRCQTNHHNQTVLQCLTVTVCWETRCSFLCWNQTWLIDWAGFSVPPNTL